MKKINYIIAIALFLTSLCTFSQSGNTGHWQPTGQAQTYIPKCDGGDVNFWQVISYSASTNTVASQYVSNDLLNAYVPQNMVFDGHCRKWKIDAGEITGTVNTFENCREISLIGGLDASGTVTLTYPDNTFHTIEVFNLDDRVLPSWNSKDDFSLLETVIVDATGADNVFVELIGCEIQTLPLPPPTVLFSSVRGNRFIATGSDFIEYRLLVGGIEVIAWTTGSGTIGGGFLGLNDGETITVEVRNANGDVVADTWVRPDSCNEIDSNKLDTDGNYADVNIALNPVYAYDNLLESPSPINSFTSVFDFYVAGSFKGTFNRPIADIAQSETFTFDLASLSISGDFEVRSKLLDGIGGEATFCSKFYTQCLADYILPLANPVTIAGGSSSDNFITKQFFNISNVFSTNGSLDILNSEATFEAYNHTTLTTIYPQETVSIGAAALGTFTANELDETIYYYNLTDVCGKQVRLTGSDSHITYDNGGEQQSPTNSFGLNPANFQTNPVQIGFKTIAKGGTIPNTYPTLFMCSQSGVRSENPAFADFATFEWTITNNATLQTVSSGLISGYNGICFDASAVGGYSIGQTIIVILTIVDTNGNTNSRTETFTL